MELQHSLFSQEDKRKRLLPFKCSQVLKSPNNGCQHWYCKNRFFTTGTAGNHINNTCATVIPKAGYFPVGIPSTATSYYNTLAIVTSTSNTPPVVFISACRAWVWSLYSRKPRHTVRWKGRRCPGRFCRRHAHWNFSVKNWHQPETYCLQWQFISGFPCRR